MLVPNCSTRDDVPVGQARIRIGAFEEQVEVVLEYWDSNRYKAQWIDGIRRIVDGKPSSCLITSITNPATANFVTWWPIYRDGSTVRFQNQVLFCEELTESFDSENPYRLVPKRSSYSDDGSLISEWAADLGCLKCWLGSA